MFKITILQIGKTKTPFLAAGEAEFMKRLQTFCQIEIKTLKDVKNLTPSKQISSECHIISKNINHSSYIIALDEKGTPFSSISFSQKLEDLGSRGHSQLTFIIGGPYGLCRHILEQADLRLSCSSFTFTHEMIRLILLEQIYRAFSITAGKKYHH